MAQWFDLYFWIITLLDVANGAGTMCPDQETRRLLQGRAGGRQADALERPVPQLFQPLQAQAQVSTALAGGQGVDLIHKDPPQAGQDLAPGRLGQQDSQTLRRG